MRHIPSETLLSIIDAQIRLVGLKNDLSAVMDLASSTAVALTKADGAVVELLEGDDIVYRSACGIAERQLGLRMPVANSLSGFCLTNRIAATCTDSETDDRVNREACRKVGLRAMTIVPLIADGQAVAVMKLIWVRPHAFDNHESETAQLLANMAATLMRLSASEGPTILRQRFTQDEATGTANRAYFYEQLQAKLAAAQAAGGRIAVAVIRIKGIESLLEKMGPASSSLLLDISRRIESECRVGDAVARIAGDEFAVILNAASRRSIVTSQLHRISRAISAEPLLVASDVHLQLTLQAGAASYPDDAHSAADLVQAARVMLGADCPNVELRIRKQ